MRGMDDGGGGVETADGERAGDRAGDDEGVLEVDSGEDGKYNVLCAYGDAMMFLYFWKRRFACCLAWHFLQEHAADWRFTSLSI